MIEFLLDVIVGGLIVLFVAALLTVLAALFLSGRISQAEDEQMAIAGSATTAFQCQVQGGELIAIPRTTLRSECVKVKDAIPLLARGEQVTLAGSDMAELRKALGV